MKHIQDADFLCFYLSKMLCLNRSKVKLIGSLSKGQLESNNDIDILLPPDLKKISVKKNLVNWLDAKSVSDTDWDGWFFHDTYFGNVDIFFSTKYFDY